MLLLREPSLAMALWEGPGAVAAAATEPTRLVELLLLDDDDPFEDEPLVPDVPADELWRFPEVLPELPPPPPRWLPERDDCDEDCGCCCCCWLGLAVFELTQEPVVPD